MAKLVRKPPKIEDLKELNLEKENPKKIVNLNLSTTHDFRKELKRYALEHDTSMVDIVMKSFNYFKKNNP